MFDQSFSCVQPFATPWTVVHQAPLSMGLCRQEYSSRLPFLTPADLPNQGIELASLGFLHWQANSSPLNYQGSPRLIINSSGREKQPHAQGQGRWLGGPTPGPRSRGCAGAGGPRGAIPLWRSGRAAVRRYPSSKVRSNGRALLEQPWRDTPHPR